jgi:hypothetical protein
MVEQTSESEKRKLAELVQQACIEAARDGFQDALMSGLCAEGAMESAISAIEKLDLEKIIHKSNRDG